MGLGVEVIDNQHKMLLNLINKIIVSIESNTQIRDIEGFIDDALAYAQYHFETEEKLLVDYGLNSKTFEEHKQKHDDFRSISEHYYQEIKSNPLNKYDNGIELLTKMYTYLINWLITHIVHEDKKIFEVLKV